MPKLKRTTPLDADFQNLVKLLDEDLVTRNGREQSFYDQFNKINKLKYAVVYYEGRIAAGCGAFKEFDGKTIEIKRMFVRRNFRGKGIGAAILVEIESWAAEINYSECLLETGKTQTEALHLYQKAGYAVIPNYGQYINVESSICMKKSIK